ncbi:MAG: aspartate/glutamate racemase family protein [Alphaproteobacteria bacterium]|nr:aspartate/glutamate racemase family protein [Alphaproteobacteria bacterium]MCB9975253.1 aspartate/glutamate racemase family protein [Rhodospirillales bacterium]
MKTVGIVGGLSPESTITYYKGLNEAVQARLGGHHNARILLNSLDFGEFVELKERGDWDTQGKMIVTASKSLEKAGADFVMLATNTMHRFAEEVEKALHIPFLHLADATARQIRERGLKKAGLLGTAYTMEQDFYKKRLIAQGIEPLVPEVEDRSDIHHIIYEELCRGVVRDESRNIYQEVIAGLIDEGAQAVILGCTEIGMLIGPGDVPCPVFDTTKIHIEAAAQFIFDEAESAAA